MTKPPVDRVIESIREVRLCAQDLERACIRAAGTGVFLHIAYDAGVVDGLSLAEHIVIAKIDAADAALQGTIQ